MKIIGQKIHYEHTVFICWFDLSIKCKLNNKNNTYQTSIIEFSWKLLDLNK